MPKHYFKAIRSLNINQNRWDIQQWFTVLSFYNKAQTLKFDIKVSTILLVMIVADV